MSHARKIIIFEKPHNIANYLVTNWVEQSKTAIAKRGCFNAILTGGKTPIEFYCKLSLIKDYQLWQKTNIFISDERYVPSDSVHNNYNQLKENLISYINIPKENLHPILTNVDISLSAKLYEDDIKQFFKLQEGEWPVFDYILLGIGEDGHVASLFPEHSGISEKNKMVIPVKDPKVKHKRISLTLPVINHGRQVILLAKGMRKADIMHKLIEEKMDLPAGAVYSESGKTSMILDSDAALRISYKDSFVHEGEAISLIK